MAGTLKFTPQGFSTSLAADLANLVYAAEDQFEAPTGRPSRWPLTPPFELMAEVTARLPSRETERFGFVARRTDTGDVCVAFRGTKTVGDWLANFELRQVAQQHGWGRVEDGFARIYAQCSPAIVGAVRDAGVHQVTVTGHSLGGALATLCAADIRATLGVGVTLYSFASPRAGDPAFAARFGAECPGTWRVVNTEDIITTVPVASTALEEFNLGGLTRAAKVIRRIPVIGRALSRPFGWINALGHGEVFEHVGTPVNFTVNLGSVLSNHSMDRYAEALGLATGAPAPSRAPSP